MNLKKNICKKTVTAFLGLAMLMTNFANTNYNYKGIDSVHAIPSTWSANYYASRYYKNYNTDYIDLSGYGGDCANFVSQCLHAGGLEYKKDKRNPGKKSLASNWWYNSANSAYTESWGGCNKLRAHLETRCSMSCTGYNSKSRVYDAFKACSAGDVLFMGTSIISSLPCHSIYIGRTVDEVDGSKYIRAYGHTDDAVYEITLKDGKIKSIKKNYSEVETDIFEYYKSFRLERTSKSDYV